MSDHTTPDLETDGPAVPDGREPASVTGQPSDEELDACADEFLDWNNDGIRAFARAVLARWGHQPAPPAEGEVAEFITQLKSYAEYGTPIRLIPFVIDRAAALLERLASPACVVLKPSPELIEAFQDALPGRIEPLLEQRDPTPVPVSERLPGPEDCDKRGRCWAWRHFDPYNDDDGEFWQLIPAEWLYAGGDWTHWLSAHALPIPGQGEI